MGEGNMEQEEPYRIPVYLISGFLGAGKTTFILQLLGTKPVNEKWAIVINEFGKISIDGQTLQSFRI
jgi:G3E family GTPase